MIHNETGKADSRVSSNWALRFPSIVVAVQLSGQWISSQLAPRLSICQAQRVPSWLRGITSELDGTHRFNGKHLRHVAASAIRITQDISEVA